MSAADNKADTPASLLCNHPKLTICRLWKDFRQKRQKSVIYQELPYLNSIRLLHIQPDVRGQRLNCVLHTTRLDGHLPPYEALSYAWGSNPERPKITCNGRKMSIGRNLEQALQRLRKTTEPRLVWVDAVCINQKDPEERRHQVRQMYSIYERADRVLIWLGPDTKGRAPEAFSIVCAIANEVTKSTERCPLLATFETTCPKLGGHGQGKIPPLLPEHWRAVRALFLTAWFVRMWVIQEIVLPRQAVFFWGKAEIDWAWLRIAVKKIHDTAVLHALLESRGMQNAFFMHWICPRYPHDDGSAEDKKKADEHSFLYLLDWARSFDVSNPRDKIYGLLGIPIKHCVVAEGNVFIDPDYGLPVPELYTRVAHRVLVQDRTLDFLSFVVHPGPSDRSDFSNRLAELPSWVPDWSQKIIISALMAFQPRDQYWAATKRPLAMLPGSQSPRRISFRGVRIARVASRLPDVPFMGLRASRALLGRHVQACMARKPRNSSTPLALAKTLTGGRCKLGWRLTAVDEERHAADFAAFLLALGVDDKSPLGESWRTDQLHAVVARCDASAERAHEALWRYMCFRALFFTEDGEGKLDGLMGLGPATVEAGDWVVLLFGAQVPFVLREVEEESYPGFRCEKRAKTWLFVGECYLEGVMEGEVIDRLDSEKGVYEEEWFELT